MTGDKLEQHLINFEIAPMKVMMRTELILIIIIIIITSTRFENFTILSLLKTSLLIDFLTLPKNFSFFLFSFSGSL